MNSRDRSREWTNPLFLYADKGGRQSFYGLFRALEDGELIVPEYQRGCRWTREQQRRWVGYVLSGAPLPAIFIRQVNVDGGFRDEILDGQQRLTALFAWVNGEVDALIPWSGKSARCESDMDRRMLERIAIPVVVLPPETTTREAARLYLDLNTAGTPHSDEDLEPVRRILGSDQ